MFREHGVTEAAPISLRRIRPGDTVCVTTSNEAHFLLRIEQIPKRTRGRRVMAKGILWGGGIADYFGLEALPVLVNGARSCSGGLFKDLIVENCLLEMFVMGKEPGEKRLRLNPVKRVSIMPRSSFDTGAWFSLFQAGV